VLYSLRQLTSCQLLNNVGLRKNLLEDFQQVNDVKSHLNSSTAAILYVVYLFLLAACSNKVRVCILQDFLDIRPLTLCISVHDGMLPREIFQFP